MSTVQFSVSRTEIRPFVVDLNHSLCCPKCGSPDVEITPGIAWRTNGKWAPKYAPAVMICEACGKVSKLTEVQALSLALHIITHHFDFEWNSVLAARHALEMYEARCQKAKGGMQS